MAFTTDTGTPRGGLRSTLFGLPRMSKTGVVHRTTQGYDGPRCGQIWEERHGDVYFGTHACTRASSLWLDVLSTACRGSRWRRHRGWVTANPSQMASAVAMHGVRPYSVGVADVITISGDIANEVAMARRQRDARKPKASMPRVEEEADEASADLTYVVREGEHKFNAGEELRHAAINLPVGTVVRESMPTPPQRSPAVRDDHQATQGTIGAVLGTEVVMDSIFHGQPSPTSPRGFGEWKPKGFEGARPPVLLPAGSKHWQDAGVSWQASQARCRAGVPPEGAHQSLQGVGVQQAVYDQYLRMQANVFELVDENRRLLAQISQWRKSHGELSSLLTLAQSMGFDVPTMTQHLVDSQQARARASPAHADYDTLAVCVARAQTDAQTDTHASAAKANGLAMGAGREADSGIPTRQANPASPASQVTSSRARSSPAERPKAQPGQAAAGSSSTAAGRPLSARAGISPHRLHREVAKERQRVAAMPKIGPPGSASGDSGTWMRADGFETVFNPSALNQSACHQSPRAAATASSTPPAAISSMVFAPAPPAPLFSGYVPPVGEALPSSPFFPTSPLPSTAFPSAPSMPFTPSVPFTPSSAPQSRIHTPRAGGAGGAGRCSSCRPATAPAPPRASSRELSSEEPLSDLGQYTYAAQYLRRDGAAHGAASSVPSPRSARRGLRRGLGGGGGGGGGRGLSGGGGRGLGGGLDGGGGGGLGGGGSLGVHTCIHSCMHACINTPGHPVRRQCRDEVAPRRRPSRPHGQARPPPAAPPPPSQGHLSTTLQRPHGRPARYHPWVGEGASYQAHWHAPIRWVWRWWRTSA